MKKVLVVTSVDSNPEYTFYIEYFIKFWLLQKDSSANIEFIPLVICVNFKPDVNSNVEIYTRVEWIDSDFSTKTLSQLIRIMATPKLDADFVMTTDIDMISLSTSPFVYAVRQITDSNSQIVVVRDVLDAGQFPVCYNIASPETWGRQLQSISSDLEIGSLLRRIPLFFPAWEGDWFLDQKILYSIFTNQSEITITKLTDSQTGLRRLDRRKHRFPFNWLALNSVRGGLFTEYHAARRSIESSIFLSALSKFLRTRN